MKNNGQKFHRQHRSFNSADNLLLASRNHLLCDEIGRTATRLLPATTAGIWPGSTTAGIRSSPAATAETLPRLRPTDTAELQQLPALRTHSPGPTATRSQPAGRHEDVPRLRSADSVKLRSLPPLWKTHGTVTPRPEKQYGPYEGEKNQKLHRTGPSPFL